MKEYRIITWNSNIKDTEPWNAFIFEPKNKTQTPADYYAEFCGLLDAQGKLQIGKTENEAIAKLFNHSEVIKKNDIFERNSVFGKEKK